MSPKAHSAIPYVSFLSDPLFSYKVFLSSCSLSIMGAVKDAGAGNWLKMKDVLGERLFLNTLCLLFSISMRSWHCRWWSARVW